MRRAAPIIVLSALLIGGCVRRSSAPAKKLALPAVGVAGLRSFIIEESVRGPIVLVFPGRSAPTDDKTLGIRSTAMRVSEKLEGSVAIFSWMHYAQAKMWVRREAAKRRARGERVRLALIGHSWGGQAASSFTKETLKQGIVDEVTLLVTIDAICKGYIKGVLYQLPSMFTLEIVFPHRLRLVAFRGTPRPDGKTLVRHINYYQMDSPQLCGTPIATADENHEIWLDSGREPGHGNLDNLIAELVAEDVRRAFLSRSAK
jgi:pimeloyl-ACP methyl ester carboxylesterase